MKKLLLSLLFICCLYTPVSAEYFSDIIVTGPNGAWIDARAYTTLNTAVAAAGANYRTIHIYTKQTVTNLTVPSNISLEFGREGSIENSGTLTIQTKDIIAPNRQIFTDTGQIDFADGTIVKSAWFQNCETALALTSNDKVVLNITKPQTLTASFAVGNNVILRWDAPENILTTNAGITISNIRHIEAGNYQIFAGSGTFSFYDQITLNINWFPTLRALLTWISSTTANLELNSDYVVDYTDSVPATLTIHIISGELNIANTKTLTILGNITNDGDIVGLGTLHISGNIINNGSVTVGSFTILGNIINNGTIEVDGLATSGILQNNGDITGTGSVTCSGPYYGIGTISVDGAISMTGLIDIPNNHYIFTGTGTVTGLTESRPEWWGNTDGSFEKALASLQ